MKASMGRKGDYAVRAVLYLCGTRGDGLRKSREIAATMEIPERYLPQVLALMVRAGFIDSVAGPGGGYRLARAPGEISLLEIVEAAEGPIQSERCVLRGGPCHWQDRCAIHDAWASAQEVMSARLAQITFLDLTEVEATLQKNRPTVS